MVSFVDKKDFNMVRALLTAWGIHDYVIKVFKVDTCLVSSHGNEICGISYCPEVQGSEMAVGWTVIKPGQRQQGLYFEIFNHKLKLLWRQGVLKARTSTSFHFMVLYFENVLGFVRSGHSGLSPFWEADMTRMQVLHLDLDEYAKKRGWKRE